MFLSHILRALRRRHLASRYLTELEALPAELRADIGVTANTLRDHARAAADRTLAAKATNAGRAVADDAWPAPPGRGAQRC